MILDSVIDAEIVSPSKSILVLGMLYASKIGKDLGVPKGQNHGL